MNSTVVTPPLDAEIPTSTPSIIQEAIERVLIAERPVILAGGSVIRSNACDSLRTIAEMLQIPVTTTQNGRGCFDDVGNKLPNVI